MKKIMCLFVMFIYLNFIVLQTSSIELTNKAKLKAYERERINLLNHSQNHGASALSTSNPILYQGWVHYIHESHQSNLFNIHKFYQNNQYFNQVIPSSEKDKTDKYGKLVIPDKTSYYMIVYQDRITFYSSRSRIQSNAVDSFSISTISVVPEDKPEKGGIRDLGKIDKYECLQILTEKPKKLKEDLSMNEVTYKNELWSVCFDNVNNKKEVVSALLDRKIKVQRNSGIYVTYDQINEKNKKEEENNIEEADEENSRDPQDGVMQLLQDWSECTLKCGGGKSYQQYMCIPPKNSGAPCKGELIRSKDCNTQPCPVSKFIDGKLEDQNKEDVKKPIVKIGPYSKNANRYTKCVIKEGEGYRMEFSEESNKWNRLPSKLILNNRTMSIFEDDSYTNLILSFNLDQTTLERGKEFCSFVLKDSENKTTIRGFDQSCGSLEEDLFVKSWESDFNLFKNECKNGLEENLISDSKDLERELKKRKTSMASIDEQDDKANKIREEYQIKQQSSAIENIAETEKLGVKAIEKEAVIEKMILDEEKEKEALQLKTLQAQIQLEKKKANKINNQIKEKELDEMFVEQSRKAEEELVESKKSIQNKVQFKRSDLQKKIENIKKMAKLRKNQLMGELRAAKIKLAKQVMQAMKTGNAETCDKGKTDFSIREKYCNNAFPDDFMSNEDCKEEDNFCYTCCEKEFGNMHLNKREECFDVCDGLKKLEVKDNKKKVENPIKWNWKPE